MVFHTINGIYKKTKKRFLAYVIILIIGASIIQVIPKQSNAVNTKETNQFELSDFLGEPIITRDNDSNTIEKIDKYKQSKQEISSSSKSTDFMNLSYSFLFSNCIGKYYNCLNYYRVLHLENAK